MSKNVVFFAQRFGANPFEKKRRPFRDVWDFPEERTFQRERAAACRPGFSRKSPKASGLLPTCPCQREAAPDPLPVRPCQREAAPGPLPTRPLPKRRVLPGRRRLKTAATFPRRLGFPGGRIFQGLRGVVPPDTLVGGEGTEEGFEKKMKFSGNRLFTTIKPGSKLYYFSEALRGFGKERLQTQSGKGRSSGCFWRSRCRSGVKSRDRSRPAALPEKHTFPEAGK